MRKIFMFLFIFLFLFKINISAQDVNDLQAKIDSLKALQEKIQSSTETDKMNNLLQYHIQKKNPFVPAGLSVVIPGLGQFYNGDYKKASCFLDAALISVVIGSYGKEEQNIVRKTNIYSRAETPHDDLGSILYLTTMFFSSIDAYRTVTKRNNELKIKYNIDLSLNYNKINLSYHF